jgi:NTE family protein
LLNPVPIAPTFRDFTDLTVAVNLNGAPRPVGRSREENEEGERNAEVGDLRSRIRQFLDTIGGSLRSPEERDLGMFELISRSFETMQNAISGVKLAAYAPDVVIEVPRDACGAHEFYRAGEMIELGYRLAGQEVPGQVGG